MTATGSLPSGAADDAPLRLPPAYPWRRFAPVRHEASRDGRRHRVGAAAGPLLELEQAQYELAGLFDGRRDARGVLQAARNRGLDAPDAAGLEALALRLAQAGVLEPGRYEPLPVPASSPVLPARTRLPLSSTLPGTLAVPNLTGSLTGLWGARRGEPSSVDVPLDPRLVLPLGRLLNLPLAGAWSVLLLLAAVGGSVVVIVNHRFEMARDLLRLGPWLKFFMTAIVCAYLVSALTSLARAAAVARFTRSRPHFGITRGTFGIPYFFTDTSGHAELASRGARIRIIASVLTAELMLFVLSVALWLMYHRRGGMLPPLALQFGLLCGVFFVLQFNPLTRRDGYALMSNAFDVGNLREQALFALFGYSNPWAVRNPPPAGVLFTYLLLVAVYLIWIPVSLLAFPAPRLKAHLGPIGPLLLVAALIYFIYVLQRPVFERLRGYFAVNASKPSNILTDIRGWIGKHLLPKSRLHWMVLIGIVVLLLLPYPYEPSGSFVVLPQARADARAQVAGEVRTVWIKEGDEVTAGQALARVADDDEKAQVAAAEAGLAKLQADLALAKQGGKPEAVEQARQEVATAGTRLQFSREEADRLAAAFKRKAVSEQDYKKALSVAEVNQQQLIEARRHLALIGSPDTAAGIQAIEAEIDKQKSELDYARGQLAYTVIRAPIAGEALSGTLQFAVGDYLQRGDRLATVVDRHHLQVEIKVPEEDVPQVRPGAKAWAKAWGLPGSAFRGTVTSIAPSAEDAPYGKVVRVYMTIDQPDARLAPEMTGYAKVRGHWYPVIVAFTRPIVRFFMVEIWSWLP